MDNEKKARKIVINQLPNFKINVLLSFIIALAIQLIGLIPPLLMQYIIDDYIPNNKVSETIYTIGLFVLIPIVSTVSSSLYNYTINVRGRKFGQKLTLMAMEKILYQPMKYFDRHNSSELAAYCKSEAMGYVVFWIFDIPQLFASLLSGVVVYIFISSINLYIAIALLAYIPLSLLPSKFLANRVNKHSKTIVEENAKASQVMADTFKAIKLVKSMSLEEQQVSKLETINKKTVRLWGKIATLDNLNSSWTNVFVETLFTGVVFAVAAILIINGHFSLGQLILLLSYIPKIFAVIKQSINTNFNFKKDLARYDKFFSILTMKDEKEAPKHVGELKFEHEIVFKNVRFAYNDERGDILKGADLEIKKGTWVGLIGESGAGKTTVFDLLLRLYGGYLGSIKIDGHEITDIPATILRQNITVVAQDMFLFPGTVKENLLLVNPKATDSELAVVLKKCGLEKFIFKLPKGMDTDIGEDGIQISGGEKQRLCLARGLLRNSKILLLDEITANVDANSQDSIKAIIRALVKENKITVISVSHRMEFLSETDTIYRISNGTAQKTHYTMLS
ncbi:MAG: ABC transporter ATP-binding protein [Clostridia bacterium]|nr:ABC transporter ATP-binding protein [Clostridia bacterium]